MGLFDGLLPPTDDGGGFRSTLGDIGTALMMMDPMSQNAGIAMAKLNADRRDERVKRKTQNQTASWLQTKGVAPDEAAFIASSPQALSSWYSSWKSGSKPDTEFRDITTPDGKGTQTVWVDKNNPGELHPVGGIKPFDNADKAPTLHDFYAADGSTYVGQWDPVGKKWDQIGGNKAPTGMSIVSDGKGGFTLTQGAGAGNAPTQSQAKTDDYLTRMDADSADIDTYAPDMVNPGAAVTAANTFAPGLTNRVAGDRYQLGTGASERWITAVLRQDSQGQIGPQEIESYRKMYLPQPGDGPANLAAKARGRAAVRQGMQNGASPKAALNAAAPRLETPAAPAAAAPAAAATKPTTPTGGLAKPQTQADFDALQKGDHYIDPDDGQEYVK